MKFLARLKRRFRRLGLSAQSPERLEMDRRAFIAAGDRARDGGEWLAAGVAYANALALKPSDHGLLIQYGHVLKEAGRMAEALGAYQAAVDAAPDDIDAWMQLGHLRKQVGQSDGALDAYAEALRRRPDYKPARDELLAAGARDRLTLASYGASAATTTLAAIGDILNRNLTALQDLRTVSTFPVEAYDAFRKAHPIQPAPQAPDVAEILVIIHADGAEAHRLRDTLRSLEDQRAANWRVIVRGAGHLVDHPVASASARDHRIVFATHPDAGPTDQATLHLEAGTILDREALGWFAFAHQRRPDAAIYADHDHYLTHWRTGVTRLSPALLPAPDRHDLETTGQAPATVLLPAGRALSDPWSARGALLSCVADGVSLIHIPRLLSSTPAKETGPQTHGVEQQPDSADTLQNGGQTIRVIIPTRDQAEILRRCIDSLSATAARPMQLRFVVMDNNSVEPATEVLLQSLVRDGRAEVVPAPEPFNWSRLNNLGVANSDEDILVFANNDIEMLSPGWDDALRRLFANDDVGVIGARLLYPDQTLQHVGIAISNADNRPHHEGSGAEAHDHGPLGRWARRRQATAVTGAFMAVRRAVFDQVGGFNETLAIGYNDIDFCLRVRSTGRSVVFEPAIEAIHYESKTRGLNNTPEKVAFDDSELHDLYRVWGDDLFHDPTINPQWTSSHGRFFDGLRDLSLSQIIDWMNRSAESSLRAAP